MPSSSVDDEPQRSLPQWPGALPGSGRPLEPSDFFKTSRCSKSLAFSQTPDLRFQLRDAANGLGLALASTLLALQMRPAIEQRRTDSKLGCYFGRAATTGAPKLQRFAFVLLGVARSGASRLLNCAGGVCFLPEPTDFPRRTGCEEKRLEVG